MINEAPQEAIEVSTDRFRVESEHLEMGMNGLKHSMNVVAGIGLGGLALAGQLPRVQTSLSGLRVR